MRIKSEFPVEPGDVVYTISQANEVVDALVTGIGLSMKNTDIAVPVVEVSCTADIGALTYTLDTFKLKFCLIEEGAKQRLALLKYKGRKIEDLEHIPEISFYNNNYYKGDNGDVLFAQSDDDVYTEWYICDKDKPTDTSKHIPFGESYLSMDKDEVIEEGIDGDYYD